MLIVAWLNSKARLEVSLLPVLIAAAFCMFNRYVDGLATFTPVDPMAYDQMGQRMAKEGYVRADTGVAAS